MIIKILNKKWLSNNNNIIINNLRNINVIVEDNKILPIEQCEKNLNIDINDNFTNILKKYELILKYRNPYNDLKQNSITTDVFNNSIISILNYKLNNIEALNEEELKLINDIKEYGINLILHDYKYHHINKAEKAEEIFDKADVQYFYYSHYVVFLAISSIIGSGLYLNLIYDIL